MLRTCLTIPVVREIIKVKLATAIAIGALTTFTGEVIQAPPLVALKTIKILSI